MKTKKCLQIVGKCYEKGEFQEMYPLLDEDCEWHSDWRVDGEKGKEEIVKYYEKKGTILQRCGDYPNWIYISLYGSQTNVLGPALLLVQKIEGIVYDLVLRLCLGRNEKIMQIELCMKERFYFQMRDFAEVSY